MRLFALTALVMVAFAANSILNRAALAGGEIGALEFAAIRLVSGGVALSVLLALRDRGLSGLRGAGPVGVLALSAYVIGFSMAYLGLDAGAGALILFAGVQVTMFAGAVLAGEAVPARRWLGAGLALAGLAWLLWPEGAARLSLLHGAMMGVAALGWGVYSLIGRRAGDPLAATAGNFVFAAPLAGLVVLLAPAQLGGVSIGLSGAGLAVVSGVVTSGLGYALWYAVLPRLSASVAALAQLTVPVIAVAGGVLLLGEAVSLRLVLSCLLVVGGVALGVSAQRTSRSSGS